MRVLLVHPAFPTTYWGFQYSLELVGKKATLPPLGLLSVAALLPAHWRIRLVDMNVSRLRPRHLRWADAVLVTGMLIQEPWMHEVIAQANAAGCRTIVGGPACTTSPERFTDADHRFRGEAEGRVGDLVGAIQGRSTTPTRIDAPSERPSLADTPIPRFDLLDMHRYETMSIQTSRGGPVTGELCDVIEIFDRAPRVKPPHQVLDEIDALYALGYRGEIVLVGDNFIANEKAVRSILAELVPYQKRAGHPFTFHTEASIHLADDDELVAQMREAGFTSVFIGLKAPDSYVVPQTGKQSIGTDVRTAVDKLTSAGMEVIAGFIVGFDGDDPIGVQNLKQLLRDAPLPLAMAGLLTALPGTALWRRLEREGRLREHSDDDAFTRPNFTPAMLERELLESYADLLATLYSAESYYRRVEALVQDLAAPAHPTPLRPRDLAVAVLTTVHLGTLGPRRAEFWRLLARTAGRGPHGLRTAIAGAIRGEHMIRYTEEVVLPRLRRAARSVPENVPTVSEGPRGGEKEHPSRYRLRVVAPGIA